MNSLKSARAAAGELAACSLVMFNHLICMLFFSQGAGAELSSNIPSTDFSSGAMASASLASLARAATDRGGHIVGIAISFASIWRSGLLWYVDCVVSRLAVKNLLRISIGIRSVSA